MQLDFTISHVLISFYRLRYPEIGEINFFLNAGDINPDSKFTKFCLITKIACQESIG
jgi:hypothetical protein